jgi:two-component system nitrogen regulation response regulator NtrX
MSSIIPIHSATSAAITKIRCGVLVVHHQAEIRDYVLEVLAAGGYEGLTADDSTSALRQVVRRRPSLVLLADRLASGSDDALKVVERLARGPLELPVIVMSMSWNGDLAHRAIARGAFDVIEQPWDPADILRVVERAIAGSRWRREAACAEAAAQYGDDLIGVSKATVRLRKMIEGAASVDRPVLLTGASGSGKEFAARQIHRNSRRANRPFVAANCAAGDAGRIGQMLFGADTADELESGGATPGAIERAHGGTVYINGIEASPASCQRKLLLFLLEGALERAEGRIKIAVDARLIVATTGDLQKEVASGRFRADLFYRLKSMCIRIPSLADRRDDIPILVRYFLQRLSAAKKLPVCDIDASALAALQAADWPGQSRELRNIVERLLIIASTRGAPITARSLPADIVAGGTAGGALGTFAETMGLSFDQARTQFERFFLAAQIARFSGNISRTAAFLRMGRSTLHRKLKSPASATSATPAKP